MIKTNLKNLTVPAIYTLALLVFGTSMYLIQKAVNNQTFEDNTNMEYVDKEIVNDNIYIPVVSQTNIIIKPYINEEVSVSKTFYDYMGESASQENSIIYYENTYMQNSGIDYKHTEMFEVVAILDGTVIEVTNNEILGQTIKIRHENDLISTYQSLEDLNVKVDDTIVRGQVIATSGSCSLYSSDYNLHFELTHQGKNVNPEEYYEKTTDEL
ncbi:MAG: M23 family metallopeptidase [Bacilli bacterium]|nr:M23 family metallopeptidase [Bacilli bacterium]